MGYVNNYCGVDLSIRSIKRQKDESVNGQEKKADTEVKEKTQVVPETKPVTASSLDAIANIAKGEINVRGKKDCNVKTAEVEKPEIDDRGGESYEELVRLYYDMAESSATDEELIPILQEIIDKWTPDSIGIYGETRNLWQATLAFRINRAYFTDTLSYLEEGGDPSQVNFDEIAAFEKDLAETYKVPQDKYYEQNRRCVYGALVHLYSIMLMRPGLSEEDKLKLETKLEDVKNKLEQFQ